MKKVKITISAVLDLDRIPDLRDGDMNVIKDNNEIKTILDDMEAWEWLETFNFISDDEIEFGKIYLDEDDNEIE